MADVKKAIERFLSVFLPLFYGWLVSLVILYKFIKHGKKFFKTEIVEAPRSLFDPKLGKHGFVQLKNQGIRLEYVESGDKSKPLVVLLHGFPDFWYSWRHQIPKLAQKFWVVAVNLRGYGGSDHPSEVKAYRLDVLREDVRELIETLGRESAIVIGHDWGGIIAWTFAIAYPARVSKLIAVNAPHLQAFRSVIETSWKQFFMSWYMFFFQLPYLPEFYIRSNNMSQFEKIYQKKNKKYCSDEEIEGYKHIFSQPGALTPPVNYYRANIRKVSNEPKVKQMEKMTTSTLIIWGDRDIALSTDLVKASIPFCSNLKIEMVEGAGHWVHHEEPDLVNKHIENFLNN